MPRTTADPLGEYSHHGRDQRFADGRVVVAFAVLSLMAVLAAAAAILAVAWR